MKYFLYFLFALFVVPCSIASTIGNQYECETEKDCKDAGLQHCVRPDPTQKGHCTVIERRLKEFPIF
ncbi:unnamed protein product, partial [Mesorhabditis belari]|uniref:Uncharacterized protein n=1 Tax=Mesorhabditis belari TaxID=2138241 RepID=A0AAF3FSQ7_9BILA